MESLKIRDFTDLKAWQEAHKLVISIYGHTKKFPREESFGLTQQIRRAAVSISSNIAEGFSRTSAKEKIQFYRIAHGSLTEVQNQLLISRDVEYLDKSLFQEISICTVTVSKLINGLIKSARDHT